MSEGTAGRQDGHSRLTHDGRGRIPRALVHELRTPLTAVHGYAQLLKRSLGDPVVVNRGLDVILRQTSHMAELLGQLSEVAELDGESLSIRPVRTDVLHVAREVADRAGRRGNSHELVVLGDPTVEGHCDPRRVAQVLAHIVSNAVIHSPAGGRVTIEVQRREGSTHISVTDPGVGIPPEEAERVYERYYRGRIAERAGIRGLGLGLYVAREVVVQCGGRLWHEPRDGGGTTFHVVIPDAGATEAEARN